MAWGASINDAIKERGVIMAGASRRGKGLVCCVLRKNGCVCLRCSPRAETFLIYFLLSRGCMDWWDFEPRQQDPKFGYRTQLFQLETGPWTTIVSAGNIVLDQPGGMIKNHGQGIPFILVTRHGTTSKSGAFRISGTNLNPLPPSDAVRKQKKIF